MEGYKITKTEIDLNNVKSAPTNNGGNDPQANKHIFDKLPELIAAKLNSFIDAVMAKFAEFYTKTEVDAAISNRIVKIGAGDMAKAVYDADGDGVVDKAKNSENAVNAENAKNSETAVNSQNVRGFWIARGDAEGNNTDQLFVHYYEDEETDEVLTSALAI